MKKIIDIKNWDRTPQYLFFKQFEEPFFGLTVEVDCTKAYLYCKQHNISFFNYYLHKSLCAVNEISSFKYRIVGDTIYEYSKINASPTIPRENGTFGFSYIEFIKDFNLFNEHAKNIIQQVKNSTDLIPATSGENIIHYTVLPWIKFTALQHARGFSLNDSIPKISFGKCTLINHTYTMPMSIHVHHGLMDGYHVGLYISRFQELLEK